MIANSNGSWSKQIDSDTNTDSTNTIQPSLSRFDFCMWNPASESCLPSMGVLILDAGTLACCLQLLNGIHYPQGPGSFLTKYRVFKLKVDYFNHMLESSFYNKRFSKPGFLLITKVHLINRFHFDILMTF